MNHPLDIRVQNGLILIDGDAYTPVEARKLSSDIRNAVIEVVQQVKAAAWAQRMEEPLCLARAWLQKKGGGWILNRPNDPSVLAAPFDGTLVAQRFTDADIYGLNGSALLSIDPRAGLLIIFNRAKLLAIREPEIGEIHLCRRSGFSPHLACDYERKEFKLCSRCQAAVDRDPDLGRIRISSKVQGELIETVGDPPPALQEDLTETIVKTHKA